MKIMNDKIVAVYFAYNRPDKVILTLPTLLSHNFKKIYIFTDGPKNKLDVNLIKETIKNIETLTKNKKKIIKTYYKKNLGLKKNFFKSLNYVFKREKKAIIIEDDCLISNSFVNFCSKLLDTYQNDKKVWSISGFNAIDHKTKKYSKKIFFSKYFMVWGWATWADRWFEFDQKASFWKKWKNSREFGNLFNSKYEFEYWVKIFDQVLSNKIITWDYFIQLHFFKNHKYSIIPKTNMVKNLGLDKSATNTKDYNIYLDKKTPENQRVKNLKKITKINNNNQFDKLIFNIVHHGERLYADNFFKLIIYYLFNSKRIFFKYLNKLN